MKVPCLTQVNGGEDPHRLFLATSSHSNLVCQKLLSVKAANVILVESSTAYNRPLNQRSTMFQAIPFTRAMADLLTPSPLRPAASGASAAQCWWIRDNPHSYNELEESLPPLDLSAAKRHVSDLTAMA